MTPETLEVLELADSWRREATLDSPFGHQSTNRFLKLWIAFNALYALQADHLEGDRAQLRHFAGWPPVGRAHEAGLREQVYERAVQEIAAQGVHNYRNGATVVVERPYSCFAVLDAVYQIRCNLFHGRKRPKDLRDAKLVLAGANVVAHILRTLLDDRTVWSQAAA